MKRIVVAFALCLALVLSGCEKTPEQIKVSSVTLSAGTMALNVGETGQLTAKVLPDNAADKGVTWKTSDAEVATVSTDGLVTAVGAGEAIITASAGDKSATCAVTVSAPDPGTDPDPGSNPDPGTGNIPVSSLDWAPGPAIPSSIDAGEKVTLTVQVNPANATFDGINWSSSNESVLNIISVNGKSVTVQAKSPGIAAITATAGGKSVTATFSVRSTVYAVEITSKNKEDDYMESDKALHLTKYEEYVLEGKAKASYSEANIKLLWRSDNTEYVTVNEVSGRVTAQKPYISGGEVKPVRVWGYSKEKNEIKDYVDVYVYNFPNDIEVLLQSSQEDLYFKQGVIRNFSFRVNPSTARQRVRVMDMPEGWSATPGKSNNKIAFKAPTLSSTLNASQLNKAFATTAKIVVYSTLYKNGPSTSVNLELCQWNKDDIKPMDFVYYNSSTGKYRTSDGGLRKLYKDSGNQTAFIKVPASPQPNSGETVVAIVTWLGNISDRIAREYGGMPGLQGNTGQHGFAMALHDAPLGSDKNFKWSSDVTTDDDVDKSSNWLGGTDYVTTIRVGYATDWEKAFGITAFAGHYNKERGSSHDIKPFDALIQYAKKYPVGTNTISNPDYYGGYNTRWVIPTFRMHCLSPYSGLEDYFFCLDDTSAIKRAFDSNVTAAGGEAIGTLEYYWSVNTSDHKFAVRMGGWLHEKNTKGYMRPWLIF